MYDLTTQEGRDQFVTDNWQNLALMAYRGYGAVGRGAVVVLGDENGPKLPVGYTFVEDYKDEQLDESIREYNPESEIVCVFDLEGFDLTVERYESGSPEQAPPVVYRARQK